LRRQHLIQERYGLRNRTTAGAVHTKKSNIRPAILGNKNNVSDGEIGTLGISDLGDEIDIDGNRRFSIKADLKRKAVRAALRELESYVPIGDYELVVDEPAGPTYGSPSGKLSTLMRPIAAIEGCSSGADFSSRAARPGSPGLRCGDRHLRARWQGRAALRVARGFRIGTMRRPPVRLSQPPAAGHARLVARRASPAIAAVQRLVGPKARPPDRCPAIESVARRP